VVHGGSSVDNAAELVATKGAHLLVQARSLADVVIMDTAPLLVVSDAAELLTEVDAVVLVARAHRTTRDSARRTFELLERAEIPVLGVVLVGTESPTMSFYGRHYGYGPEKATRGWRRWFFRRRDDEVVRVDARSRRMGAHASSGGAARRTTGPDDPDPEYLKAMDALDDASPTEGEETVGARDAGAGPRGDAPQEPGQG
jgi:hypothetical protein